jgi:type I restriction enzyme S subunit
MDSKQLIHGTYPAEWQFISLAELNAKRPMTINPQKFREEQFEYYSIPAYQKREMPVLALGSEIESSKLLLEFGTVLFGKLNPRVEKVWRVGNHFNLRKIGSTEWIPVYPTNKIEIDFLYYLFWSEHVMPKAKTLVSGSTPSRQRVDPKAFYKIGVPVPPLHEQSRIAHVLTTVQIAIDQQDRLIALTRKLEIALMKKLFTEGLRGEKQKETEIGLIPESWQVVDLGGLAKIGNGSTPKRDNQSYWEGGSIPWLTSGKIHERFIEQADEYVTETALKECHLPRVRPNSLLIAITGQGKTLGNSALVRIETCVSQHLAYVQFQSESIVPEFMLWYLQTRYQHLRSVSQAGGSTKGALTCGYIKTYPVPLPTGDEQIQIANIFAILYQKESYHEHKKSTLKGLFRTLMHQLMTAQIRVNEIELPDLS